MISMTLSLAFTNLIIGFLKSKVTNNSVIKGISETLLLGGLAALVAYFVGDFLEQIIK